MKNIDLFLGHFIDCDTKEMPIGISFASNYYQQKIKSILNINHSISIFYGENNKKYETKNEVEYLILKQHKHIANIFHIVKHILALPTKEKKSKTILFYNLNIYTILYFLYFKFIKKAKVVVLLADAGFLVEKNIISQLVSKVLSYSNGILTLREISELRKFKSNIEVMAGIISNNLISNESEKNPNTVLLSGSLGTTAGLFLALEYFSNQSQFKLYITGVPYLMSNLEFEKILLKYKSDYISYLGILDYNDYIRVLCSCEFSLSLRNPNDIEHNYNFPSKILEYMSYRNIVISSLKYPELSDEIYYQTEYSIKSLNDCFQNILDTPIFERKLLSEKAQIFVKNNFSEEVLKNKIENLFQS